MKSKLLSILVLSTLGVSLANAQGVQPANSPTVPSSITTNGTQIQIPTAPTPEVSSASVDIGSGNTYEKEVTPLLREISRKKSLLEIKKLDKEIAKLDEVEKPKENTGYVGLPVPQNIQPVLPSTQTSVAKLEEENPVKVLMIYGDEDDLYAKISFGTQGGYAVKKGDVLPNGKYVRKVTNNYIEVTKTNNIKGKVIKSEKIYVGESMTSTNQNSSNANTNSMPSYVPLPLTPTMAPINTNITSGSPNIGR